MKIRPGSLPNEGGVLGFFAHVTLELTIKDEWMEGCGGIGLYPGSHETTFQWFYQYLW